MKHSTTFTSKKGFKYEVFAPENDSAFMEVTSPSGGYVSGIELELENNKRLIGYDGVFDLHKNHIRALRNAEIVVPREFES